MSTIFLIIISLVEGSVAIYLNLVTWTEWSSCSLTCGNGSRSRNQIKTSIGAQKSHESEFGVESENCNHQACRK